MQALDIETALGWRGRSVVDRDGAKIGTLKEIYLDEDDRPAWGSVHTAPLGLRSTLVPLADASVEGESLRVPYDRDHVKDAPDLDPDARLTGEEEARLYRHYGRASGVGAASPDEPDGPDDEGGTGAVAAGAAKADDSRGAGEATAGDEAAADAAGGAARTPDTATAPEPTGDAMTRSEEELRVGRQVRERGRVRLRKYVVTDYVEKKIPVRREVARIEREPPGDRGADDAG